MFHLLMYKDFTYWKNIVIRCNWTFMSTNWRWNETPTNCTKCI